MGFYNLFWVRYKYHKKLSKIKSLCILILCINNKKNSMPINSTLTLRKRKSYSELQPALQNIIFIM